MKNIKLGSVIRIDTTADLLMEGESNIGTISLTPNPSKSVYEFHADFDITKGVWLYAKEIAEVFTKEEHPEYYL
ncbi:MAG: hypothetical protein J7L15_05740 [Clostridiales bacterium]|nr:hypothetical protein [Clostridiales bacterium]